MSYRFHQLDKCRCRFQGIFTKTKKLSLSECGTLFLKVQRFPDQVNFWLDLSRRMWSTSLYVFLTPFSKKPFGQILITCLVCLACFDKICILFTKIIITLERSKKYELPDPIFLPDYWAVKNFENSLQTNSKCLPHSLKVPFQDIKEKYVLWSILRV